MSSALQNGRWVQDINTRTGLMLHHIKQFLRLWTRINQTHLTPVVPDDITWKLTLEGIYSSKYVYALHLLGSTATNFKQIIWKSPPPGTCKFFIWLAIQNRLWTSDILEARGWPNQRICPLSLVKTGSSQTIQNHHHIRFLNCLDLYVCDNSRLSQIICEPSVIRHNTDSFFLLKPSMKG